MDETAVDNSAQMKQDLLKAVPALRAFAMSLSGNPDRADDLVQETLLKAWAGRASFTPGTNVSAWLFTILRNVFYSDHRKRRREVEDAEGQLASRLATHPAQEGHMDLVDFREALQHLLPDQREALILIGGSGLSYEEAAEICGCAVGTIKSRVNRARNRLAELLSVTSSAEFGPEAAWRPALTAQGRGSDD
ncbi:MAG: sigma-70 family RNA polymerase sigma factor [Alsobacter sp.]